MAMKTCLHCQKSWPPMAMVPSYREANEEEGTERQERSSWGKSVGHLAQLFKLYLLSLASIAVPDLTSVSIIIKL